MRQTGESLRREGRIKGMEEVFFQLLLICYGLVLGGQRLTGMQSDTSNTVTFVHTGSGSCDSFHLNRSRSRAMATTALIVLRQFVFLMS